MQEAATAILDLRAPGKFKSLLAKRELVGGVTITKFHPSDAMRFPTVLGK
jgi:hypothetical protein